MNVAVPRGGSLVWTTDRTSMLISLYRKYPCLYNSKTQEYKDKAKRQEIWNFLGEKMGTTATEIMKKVRGLRTQYAREKAKMLSREHSGEEFICPWLHYNSLKFLDEFTITKSFRPSNDWPVELNQEQALYHEGHDEGDNTESLNSNAYVVSEQVKPEHEDLDDCIMLFSEVPSSSTLRNHTPRSVSPPRVTTKALKRRMVERSPEQSQHSDFPTSHQIFRGYREAVEQQQEDQTHNSDENDEIFVKYIASELKQIRNVHVKRIVKHNIQNIIFEAHCSMHKNDT